MSLTSPVPGDQSGGIVHTAQGETCFFCGQPTSDPAVHWMGLTGFDIYLHPRCATRFCIRLQRDIHEHEWTLEHPARLYPWRRHDLA